MSVRIKHSKTDPFGLEMIIFMGRTDTPIFPVAALLSYLAVRGAWEGPLFHFVYSQPLTLSLLVTKVRQAFQTAEMHPQNYAGHSFRIGAATTAAACGVPVDIIKTLGRWRSQAYHLYIELPQDQLADINKKLVSSSTWFRPVGQLKSCTVAEVFRILCLWVYASVPLQQI